MAHNVIYFEHKLTGAVKKAPVGFSWTTMFFGFFPALFRGDWKWVIIQLLLAILTANFSSLIFMFIYNKIYMKELISDGYKVKAVEKGTVEDLSTRIGFALPSPAI